MDRPVLNAMPAVNSAIRGRALHINGHQARYQTVDGTEHGYDTELDL